MCIKVCNLNSEQAGADSRYYAKLAVHSCLSGASREALRKLGWTMGERDKALFKYLGCTLVVFFEE